MLLPCSCSNLGSGAIPPIFLCDGHCTFCNVIHASNFAYALSRSPTMHSIQLVVLNKCDNVTTRCYINPVSLSQCENVFLIKWKKCQKCKTRKHLFSKTQDDGVQTKDVGRGLLLLRAIIPCFAA